MNSFIRRRIGSASIFSKSVVRALMVCGLVLSSDAISQDAVDLQGNDAPKQDELISPASDPRQNDFVLPNEFRAAPKSNSQVKPPGPLRRRIVTPIVPAGKPSAPDNRSVERSHLRLIPNTFESGKDQQPASFNGQEVFQLKSPAEFVPRAEEPPTMTNGPQANPTGQLPKSLERPTHIGVDPHLESQLRPGSKMSRPGYDRWNPQAGRDEYVYDGSDRGVKVQVDRSFNVSGLQTEDTVGHFDTLDGRRIVSPSNRVAIYAPRFAAVRRVDGVFNANVNLPVRSFDRKLPTASAQGRDESSTTKQHLAVTRYSGTKRASGFIDQTRGVVRSNTTHLFGIRNNFEPYENLSLIRLGRFSSGESARLSLGIQSAQVWEEDLGLQVTVNKATPVITRDVKTVQELLHVKSKDGTAILSVTKVASKIAARAGDTVDFTIRYDNMSNKKIGNVTIIDNLTRRLEYIPDSAESSLKADFINQRNEADSLMLRWEITEPVEPHSGGVIRFKCRVR